MIGACRNGQPFSDWMRTPLFALSQIRQAPGLYCRGDSNLGDTFVSSLGNTLSQYWVTFFGYQCC